MQSIIKSKNLSEKYINERCFISEIINTAEFESFSLSKARVLPGVTTELHAVKNTTEVYYILSGRGEMETDGNVVGMVGPGDVVFIPKEMAQRIKNIGAEDLIFLCICSPRFMETNYVSV